METPEGHIHAGDCPYPCPIPARELHGKLPAATCYMLSEVLDFFGYTREYLTKHEDAIDAEAELLAGG